MPYFRALFLTALATLFSFSLWSQPASGTPSKGFDIFLDCGDCDMNFMRQETDFVNHVRDAVLADVHVWINRQFTGGGGRTYELTFIGKEKFEGLQDTLYYHVPQTFSADERRQGLVRMLKMGLVRYVAHSDIANEAELKIKTDAPKKAIQPEEDPWNNWIFEVYGSANMDKESARGSIALRYGADADRVTEDWRIRSRVYMNYREKSFINDGETISTVQRNNGGFASMVKSMGDHWSAGVSTSYASSTYNNLKQSLYAGPAVEYNIFPYQDAMRKEFTFAYRAGVTRRDYEEVTVYDVIGETLYRHSLSVNLRLRQPWGSFFAGLEGSHYLHDFSKHRIEFDGNLNVRVFKGLAVRLSSGFEIIQDQLSLPKGNASLEEILLQQVRQATSYDMSLSVGISYTFGSIYNNVVNTRL